jgi:two-component system cell cycle sensor histidine kinase/response regulator CckA
MKAIPGAKNGTAELPTRAPSEPTVQTRAVGLLAAGLAHDLNNMLGGILATAELVQRRARAPQDRADLAAIVAEAGKASGLVRQLLAFTRQAALRPEPVTLAGLVSGMAPTLGALLAARGDLAIAYRLDEPAPVIADRLALERVVLNLALNARAAARSRIAIETGRSGAVPADAAAFMPTRDYAWLSVADNGAGVPEAILPQLFQPFVTSRPDGQGLGLASAFGLVKQSGGFLLHDRGPMGGARFRLFLPHAEAPALPAPVKPRPLAPHRASGLGILLVEDEAVLRGSLARHLGARGHRVVEAADAGTALALHDRASALDLLLTDVRLPGMDGPALAEHLRARTPGIGVLFMTGYASAPARRALEASGDAVLVKPFTLADLDKALARAAPGG